MAAGSPAYGTAAAQAICGTTVRIMPLGDSITKGSGGEETDETKMISYRKDLWDSLQLSGYNVDFVGSQTNGTFYSGFDPDHEGWGGKPADYIRNNIYGSGGNWLQNKPADIILLHIGTNDIGTGPTPGQSPAGIVTEVSGILDKIDQYEQDSNEHVTVILAQIINRIMSSQANIDATTEYNTLLKNMAEARSEDDIILVNMETEAGIIYQNQPTGDMYWNGTNGLHPFHTGYTKMAAKWKQALDSVLESCNHPPVIDPKPVDQTSTEQASINLQVTAGDPDSGQTLTYSATNLPLGLSITPSSGLISGIVDCNASSGSPYQVNVNVKDNGVPQLSDSAGFIWTVNPKNCKPILISPGNQYNAEGAVINLQILASDPDQGDTLTFNQAGLPPNLWINADTGEISGTITYEASTNIPYNVTITATDNGNPAQADSKSFSWTVANTNRPPVVTSPGNQLHDEGQQVSLQIQAMDPDGNSLTYSAAGLPPSLGIISTNGEITGTISYAAAAINPYNVTITATDDGSPIKSGSTSFSWTVSNINRPPLITPLGKQVHAEGQEVSLQVQAVDPDGDSLTYSAVGLPPSLGINTTTGKITGVIAYGTTAGSPYSVTVKAQDPSGLNDTKTFEWQVTDKNRPPVLDPIGNLNSLEGVAVARKVTAHDPDGDALMFSTAKLPPGLSINPQSGLIGGVIPCGYAGTYTPTVTVTDQGQPALADSETLTWKVAPGACQAPQNRLFVPAMLRNSG